MKKSFRNNEIKLKNIKFQVINWLIEFIKWQKGCLSFVIQLNLTSFKTTGFLTENILHAMKNLS